TTAPPAPPGRHTPLEESPTGPLPLPVPAPPPGGGSGTGVLPLVPAGTGAHPAGRSAAVPLTSDELFGHRFTTVKFRDGYEQEHVDELLHRVVRTLHARETGTWVGDEVTAQDVHDARFVVTRF